MKNKSVKDIILRTLSAVLAVTTVSIAVIGWNGINCAEQRLSAAEANARAKAAMAMHPEAHTVIITPEIANTMYNLNLQGAQQLAAQWGTTVVAPDYYASTLNVLQGQVNMYQSYIDNLQVQYQNAMATGNVAYAQQCVNLINVWNAKKAEATNQLNRFLLTMPK